MARAENPDPDDGADDEALRWAGDEARGRDEPSLAKPATASGDAALDEQQGTDAGAARAKPVRLVGTGIFAGVFLAYTVGWIVGVQNIASGAADLFGEIMWQFGEFLAIISAALWFASTLYLTRERATAVRFGWLALGVLLLVPWPLIWGFLA